MQEIIFDDIPRELKLSRDQIHSPLLSRIYSQFQFEYLSSSRLKESEKNIYDDINSFELFLMNYLKNFKFITYNHIFLPDEIGSFQAKTSSCPIVFCVEHKCIIIEQIDCELFDKIMDNLSKDLYVINVNDNREVKEELSNFCSHFARDIKYNELVKISLYPIACFVIRRFYCPTYFFKDPSFFTFNSKEKSDEQHTKTQINNFLLSNNETDFSNRLEEITDQINSYNENLPKECLSFKLEDFIILRTLYMNGRSLLYLVIHINSLFIFMLKKSIYLEMENEAQREVYFCENFSHRCLAKCYGFVKEKDKIVGIIYEFMSNGTLDSYVRFNLNQVNDIYIFLTISRIIQGIQYLHSNKLIHRDIKPSNILIDHDFLPFISDFESIRHPIDEENKPYEPMTCDIGSVIYSSPEQYNGCDVSYPSDIYSFGMIIYFLFEKHNFMRDRYDMRFKDKPKITNCPKNIENLFERCIEFYPSDRINSCGIIKIISEESNLFTYYEQILLDDENITKTPVIVQFIYENIVLHQGDFHNLKKTFENIYYFHIIYSSKIEEDESILSLYFEKLNKYNYKKDSDPPKIYESSSLSNALLTLGYLYENGYSVKQDYAKAKEYYELLAKEWNSYALLKLGIFYFEGYGVEQDFHKCKEYFELSAIFNNSSAMVNLGDLYYNGIGVQRNISKAIKYYKSSANLNNSVALYKLGYLYLTGLGVEKDCFKAKEYYSLSAKRNKSYTLYSLGYLYYYGNGVEKDLQKCKKYFELSANLNNSSAMLFLGDLYFSGCGVDINISKAIKYYELSAKLSNSKALNNLGIIYLAGVGVEQNFIKAIKYYKLSINQNNLDSINCLGYIYSSGLGVNKDYLKAREYYELSANQNNSAAYIYLGNLYANGYGVKKDYLKAKEYFELSAKQNNSDAYIYLGNLYANGYGVKQDYLKAREYFELSANQNNSDAFYYLGNLYANGYGVKKDYLKARKYFELSANQNNSDALNALGRFYFLGYGVEQNYLKAQEYFELSAKQNNSDACNNLGLLYANGYGVKHDYHIAINYFRISIQNNNSLAYYYMGNLYKKMRDYYKARHYYELSVLKNNSNSLYKIGNLYLKGRGVSKNYLKAKFFYEQSADMNNSNAFYKLGTLYYNGLGVKQDIKKAKEYFELSGRQGNWKAFFEIGNLYFEGKGFKRNYDLAKEYYELSAYNNNNVNGFFLLGVFYSRGDILKINIPLAVQYFLKSIDSHFDQVLINNNVDNFYYIKRIYNQFYYHSHNDLGLIYLTIYNDIGKSIEHIKVAAFGEYPFGQNNFGLLNEIYLNDLIKAEYMYLRSSKNNFALAFYNLGHLKEKEKEKEKEVKKQELWEYIKYYKLASDSEDCPLIFHNRCYNDKRLEISKSFILCMTNLKLCEYYFNHGDNLESKKYFNKALAKLLNNKEHVEFKIKIDHENAESFFTYLKKFILSFPLFNLSNQPNLNVNLIFNTSSIAKKEFQEKNNNGTNFIMKPIMTYVLNYEEYLKEIKIDIERKYEIDYEIDDEMDDEIDDEIVFEDGSKIFEFIISQSKYKDIFSEQIRNIIQIMNDIIYTPPYPILFGRINIGKIKKENNPKIQNINKLFYEGLGIL